MSTSATSLTPGLHIITDTTPDVPIILSGIVHLHAACILNDGTLATFLPPLSHDVMYEWWRERLAETTSAAGTARQRHIIVCISEVAQRTGTGNANLSAPWSAQGRVNWPVLKNGLEVSGVVSLSTPFSQTGPFRALVEKLFVSPLHRRQGIARRLMVKLEDLSMAAGRWSLMLDTEVGSPAEHVYPRLGYERLGVVREYGISPKDGRLVDEVWFWKDLRKGRLEARD
jgi:GNAT superfamily N-acetyltransferase